MRERKAVGCPAVAPNTASLLLALGSVEPAAPGSLPKAHQLLFHQLPSPSKVLLLLSSSSTALRQLSSVISSVSDHSLGHRYPRWLPPALASAKRIWRTVVVMLAPTGTHPSHRHPLVRRRPVATRSRFRSNPRVPQRLQLDATRRLTDERVFAYSAIQTNNPIQVPQVVPGSRQH